MLYSLQSNDIFLLRVGWLFVRAMKICASQQRREIRGRRAFTLLEVAVSLVIAVLLCGAIMKCYTASSRRSLWGSCSLAANEQAMKKLEQVVFANWVPSYGITQIFNPALTNADPENLAMPVAVTNQMTCTNYTTIIPFTNTLPYYVMIRVDCVWSFMGLGVFTNTVAVLRGPNL
jgi:hypothetical protein